MVAGRQGIKYIYPTTFSNADSGGFEKPPLRKHKRYGQFADEVFPRTNWTQRLPDHTAENKPQADKLINARQREFFAV